MQWIPTNLSTEFRDFLGVHHESGICEAHRTHRWTPPPCWQDSQCPPGDPRPPHLCTYRAMHRRQCSLPSPSTKKRRKNLQIIDSYGFFWHCCFYRHSVGPQSPCGSPLTRYRMSTKLSTQTVGSRGQQPDLSRRADRQARRRRVARKCLGAIAQRHAEGGRRALRRDIVWVVHTSGAAMKKFNGPKTARKLRSTSSPSL